MKPSLTVAEIAVLAGALLGFLVLAGLPLIDDGFWLALAISTVGYVTLATAWTLFSGPTRYISLATAAFYGSGIYVVSTLAESTPWIVILLVAAAVGALLALVVGLSTLRLSGVYFVIFTFGLAELIRQLVTWYQTQVSGSVGRYIFLDLSAAAIYWQLLGLCALVFLIGWRIQRSRLGFALQVIGDDETVAEHCGIRTARSKVLLFCISGMLITLTGAIMAPRFTYIEPTIAYNAMVSFNVVIMALLGGTRRLWGPMVGVVPFTVLYEYISGRFPDHTYLLLGLAFLLIVYFIPNGVAGRLERAFARLTGSSGVPDRGHE